MKIEAGFGIFKPLLVLGFHFGCKCNQPAIKDTIGRAPQIDIRS